MTDQVGLHPDKVNQIGHFLHVLEGRRDGYLGKLGVEQGANRLHQEHGHEIVRSAQPAQHRAIILPATGLSWLATILRNAASVATSSVRSSGMKMLGITGLTPRRYGLPSIWAS